jgi:hypothetical protein
MIINSKLFSMVVITSLTLAMLAGPSIVSSLSNDKIPNKDIEQNSEVVESNNSETSNSESTTSFAKKGNSQNSPVPPECPKQGPIPPNCTLKPKF